MGAGHRAGIDIGVAKAQIRGANRKSRKIAVSEIVQIASIPLFSYGFRPFFFGGALWAVIAMLLWIGLLTGGLSFAGGYGAVAWHIHEFLFGYISAVVTGFLLTAVPNWTGRLPLRGAGLLLLFLTWLAGRIAMLMTATLGTPLAAMIDGAYLWVLTFVILREILSGNNWRNLKVMVLVAILASANTFFHIEVIRNGAPDIGSRLGIAAIVALIILIGGRITPSFTHNWLVKQNITKLPAPLGRFDIVAMALSALSLLLWVATPHGQPAGVALLIAAALLLIRLLRWQGLRTWCAPMVFILHAGYFFLPLGALLLALSILSSAALAQSGALHAWTTGAMGVMTLAVMTRATRGHTGRAIEAPATTIAIYVAIVFAAALRIVAPMFPAAYMPLIHTSALCWLLAFGGFVLVYGPMLLRPRKT